MHHPNISKEGYIEDMGGYIEDIGGYIEGMRRIYGGCVKGVWRRGVDETINSIISPFIRIYYTRLI